MGSLLKYFILILASQHAMAQLQERCEINEEPSIVAEGNNTVPNVCLVSRRCGGVLTAMEGGIIYKPYSRVLPNERCVWIIATPNATTYTYEVHSTSAKHWNRSTFVDVFPYYRRVLVVTFSSSNNVAGASGFELHYQATDFFGRYADTSIQNIYDSPVYDKHYLFKDESHRRGILSYSIFAPTGHTFNGESKTVSCKNLTVVRNTCDKHIAVYKFDFLAGLRGSKAWLFHDEYTDCYEKNIRVTHNDLILLKYDTWSNESDSQFWLSYA